MLRMHVVTARHWCWFRGSGSCGPTRLGFQKAPKLYCLKRNWGRNEWNCEVPASGKPSNSAESSESCVSLFCTLRPSTNVYIYICIYILYTVIYCIYTVCVCAQDNIFVIALSLRLLTTRCYVKLMHWAHCSLQATLWAGLLDLLLSCGNSIQRSAALICTALFQHKITSYKHRT